MIRNRERFPLVPLKERSPLIPLKGEDIDSRRRILRRLSFSKGKELCIIRPAKQPPLTPPQGEDSGARAPSLEGRVEEGLRGLGRGSEAQRVEDWLRGLGRGLFLFYSIFSC